jgi:hypothetical protein
MKKNPRTGSSLEDFLKDTGLHETATATALKRVLVYELQLMVVSSACKLKLISWE